MEARGQSPGYILGSSCAKLREEAVETPGQEDMCVYFIACGLVHPSISLKQHEMIESEMHALRYLVRIPGRQGLELGLAHDAFVL